MTLGYSRKKPNMGVQDIATFWEKNPGIFRFLNQDPGNHQLDTTIVVNLLQIANSTSFFHDHPWKFHVALN